MTSSSTQHCSGFVILNMANSISSAITRHQVSRDISTVLLQQDCLSWSLSPHAKGQPSRCLWSLMVPFWSPGWWRIPPPSAKGTRGEQSFWDMSGQVQTGCWDWSKGDLICWLGRMLGGGSAATLPSWAKSPVGSDCQKDRDLTRETWASPSPSDPSSKTFKTIALLMQGAGSCPHMGTSPNSRQPPLMRRTYTHNPMQIPSGKSQGAALRNTRGSRGNE